MSQGVAGLTKIAVDTANLADGASIASYLTDAAGTLLTSTLNSGKQSLDVNITSDTATETSLAAVLVELQALTFNEDSPHGNTDPGIQMLAVRNDAGVSLVSDDGDYSPLSVDNQGRLRVAGSFTVNEAGDYAEDSAHTSSDIGYFNLAVRNDDQATTFTSDDGDYSGVAVNDQGAMFVKDVANRSNLQQIVTVGTTAVALPATPMANRTSMFIQMLSSGQLYLGSSTVTNSGSTRGIQIGNGGYVNVDVGPGNLVYGIASGANKDVAVWEFA